MTSGAGMLPGESPGEGASVNPTETPAPGHYCQARETDGACGEDAIVGWGGDPILWLCLEHFQQALAEQRRLIDVLLGGGTL